MSQTSVLPESRRRPLLWLVAVGLFMQTLDGTIVNTAIPVMAQDLGVSPFRMEAVVIAYMLTVALLIPASGWLTDRFGTRKIFMFAIMLFTAGSLACALSPNLKFLVFARVVQGVGGALLVPVGRLSVLKAYPREQLVQVLSFITIPGLLGPLVGPTLGGFLVVYASWHWIFLINIPVGILGTIAALRFMPDLPAPDEAPRFDWLGFFLFGLSMVVITMSLEGIGELHMAYTPMLLLLLSGLVLLAVYCFHALRFRNPLFSPSLFKTRNFAVGIIGNLFARLGTGAMPFLTPLLLQIGLGFSPLKAGLTMIPMTIGAMIAKKMLRPLLRTLGFRWLLCINTLLLGLLIAAFSFIRADMPYLQMILLFTVFGAVNSTQFTAMNTITLLDVPDYHASSGNSLLSVVMQLSMGMGVACAAAILYEFSGATSQLQPGLVLNAFSKTFLCLGFMAAISSAIFFHVRHTEGFRKETAKTSENSAPALNSH